MGGKRPGRQKTWEAKDLGGKRPGRQKTGGQKTRGQKTGGQKTGGQRTEGQRTGGQKTGGQKTGGQKSCHRCVVSYYIPNDSLYFCLSNHFNAGLTLFSETNCSTFPF